MAVIPRKLKRGVTYYAVFAVPGRPRRVWEKSGPDRRAAERLEAKRKREVADGTYTPQIGTSRASTVAEYAVPWGARRTNRTAAGDRALLDRHVLSREWFAELRLDDVRPIHVRRLVLELQETGAAPKSVANIYGVVRTMLRDARLDELIVTDPCVLPKGTLKRRRKKERTPYTRPEAVALMTDERVDLDRRVFAAIAFYTGAREGEICGLRWSDWDREAEPLGCLTIERQYGGHDVKTETTRKVPVHPELVRILDAWFVDGFELVHCRRPASSEHIVPMRARKANRYGVKAHHTKSSAYKLFRAACKQADVENRSLHSTRHSMITWARRGRAPKDVLEKITHNATGDIVDQYTHFDWEPLCEAMLCLRYVDRDQQPHRGAQIRGDSSGGGGASGRRNAAESLVVGSGHDGSIPGASTSDRLENEGGPKTRQHTRQHLPSRLLTPARLLHEAKEIVTGERASENAEGEVLARLRRVAKTLPAFAAPKRGRRAS